MSRIATLFVIALLAGCSSPQKKAPMLPDTAEEAVEEQAVEREALQESDDCLVKVEPAMSTDAERQYAAATEQAMLEARTEFGAACGSAIIVEHTWPLFWRSAGFEADEEVGAVSDATIAFMNVTRGFCQTPKGKAFRQGAERIVFTPTDTADRVGLCRDEESGTIVMRIMLEPGTNGVEHMPDGELLQWYAENF